MFLIIPIIIGSSLFIISVTENYPIALHTPYEYKYDEISAYYWISISILIGSFYLVSINTENNSVNYMLSILSFLLIYSQDLLHYTVSTSDNNHFLALMDVFMNENILEPPFSYAYFQRPVYFIFNTIAVNLTSINYEALSFILYIITGIILTSLVYNYISRKGLNGFIGVLIFIFSIFWYLNFQSVPYTISLLFMIYILYLDNARKSNENITPLIYLSFIILSFTHVITPIYFIIYSFFKYYLSKNENDRKLFLTTLILFIGTNVYSQLFPYYLEKISVINFGQFERQVVRATREKITITPFIESLSSIISKSITIGTWIISSIGFLSSYKHKKLNTNDYSIVLTSLLFTPFIFISFQGYSQLFYRAAPLILLVFSYSALFFINKNTNKIIIIILLVISVSYVFIPIQRSFFDKQIFFISERSDEMNEFYHETFPYISKAKLLTDKRNMIYLRDLYPGQSRYSYPTYNFSQNFDNYDYILYTIGLGRSILGDRSTINEAMDNINEVKYNIIFNSGSYVQIYSRARPRIGQTAEDLSNMATARR